MVETKIMACPFFPQHTMPESRLLWHIIDCKKKLRRQDLLKFGKLKCPYNPNHILKLVDLEQHIQNDCSEKPSERELDIIKEINAKRRRSLTPNRIVRNEKEIKQQDGLVLKKVSYKSRQEEVETESSSGTKPKHKKNKSQDCQNQIF